MKKPMRRIRRFLVPFILVICLFSQASSCSLLFVGGDFTDDGANLFVRVEDGDLTTRLKAEKDLTARQEIATGESSQMAEEAQDLALALYRHIVYGEALTE